MFTSINNTTTNTTIANEILRDVIGAVGTASFVKTFVDAYKRGISKRTFTLRQWKVMKEIFRDSEDSWNAIFTALEDKMPIAFPDGHNGDEDYTLFTVWANGHYDHYHHGYERLVVKEN